MADDGEFKVRFKTYVEQLVDSAVSMNVLGIFVPGQALIELVRDYLGEEWLDQIFAKFQQIGANEEARAWLIGLIASAPEYAEVLRGWSKGSKDSQ